MAYWSKLDGRLLACLEQTQQHANTTQKMYSITALKLRGHPELLEAFSAGNYSLIGPDGEFDPSDWDTKVFPGSEFRITRKPLSENSPEETPTPPIILGLPKNSKSSAQEDCSTPIPGPRPVTPPSVKEETDLREEHSSPRPQLNTQSGDSESLEDPAAGQTNPVDAVTTGDGIHSMPDADDYFSYQMEKTDRPARKHHECVEIDGRNHMSEEPQSKRPKFQSYVEDDSEDAYSSPSIKDENLLPGFIKPGVPIRSVKDLVDEAEEYQAAMRISEDYSSSSDERSSSDEISLTPRNEPLAINVFDYLDVPQRGASIEGVNPFAYQDSNDSWTIKVRYDHFSNGSALPQDVAPVV